MGYPYSKIDIEINNPMAHFEKLLDEFEEDALAVTREGKVFPSSSRKTQYNLTRRNILSLVEGIVLENDKLLEDTEPDLKEERDLLWQYLYDAVGDMSAYDLGQASGLMDLNYCKDIIDKANEYKP